MASNQQAADKKASRLTQTAEGFELAGSIAFETVNTLWQQSLRLFEKVEHSFCVDLSKVTELDSAGLGLLVAWKKWAKTHDLVIAYTKPPNRLLALAEVNRVSSILEL
ncbi:STAS domain-containing protein [Piscirickettsia litoralis]|nr:STAS domain-containing protein [Piscirickettsia litoralis]